MKLDIQQFLGSSPLVRGTVVNCPDFIAYWRFIPARAGNRPHGLAVENKQPVHPRSCGEQLVNIYERDCPDGSSPLVRGTVLIFDYVDCLSRFIPARAGNRAG